MSIIKGLRLQYKSNPRVKQVVGLFSVNVVAIPIGIVTSIVITRYLGAQGYGDFRFIYSIFFTAVIIFSFGFFQAGNRALVLNTDKQKAKEYYGAELVIVGGIFVIMSFFLILYALLDNNIQEKQLDKFLLYLIPFGWVFLILRYFETLFQADNRIKMLSQIRLYPSVGFLATATLIFFIFMEKQLNKLAIIWIFNLATQVIVYLFILFKLKVSFKNIRIRFLEIWSYNKSYGFNVYLGTLFAIGFASLTELLISYFGVDNSGLGYYSLALTITMPLSLIPNTIATTHYKDFSIAKQVPKKLLIITIGLSLSALLVLWVMVGPFVRIFYGVEFENVIVLNFIMSFGVAAHGFADFFNRYLGANGQGKFLRNSAFFVGTSTLVFSLLLIPKLGEFGAAYTKLISGFVYLIVIIWYYFKFIKKQSL
jgi:O-antigen/teichoic acid export membrane protein